jgi:hypothetical protein
MVVVTTKLLKTIPMVDANACVISCSCSLDPRKSQEAARGRLERQSK